jgi:hypothetical protein
VHFALKAVSRRMGTSTPQVAHLANVDAATIELHHSSQPARYR